MRSAKTVGRIVGLLLLVHLVIGLILPFVWLHPVTRPNFLELAAPNALQLRAAVLLFFVGSAIPIAAAILAFPVFRRFSSAMPLWLAALSVVAYALQIVDNGAIMSMLALSQQYVSADAAKAETFQSLAIVAGAIRRWTHYTALLATVGWIFLLSGVLYRTRVVPRVLAALGLIASLLQIIGVPLRAFLGYPPEMRLAMPLAPVYAAMALWLMVKGFDERSAPHAEAEQVSAQRSPQTRSQGV